MQKTAYDVRISDWSSDVCSSDLDGSWVIAPDHLERAAAYEMARAKDRQVIVETLSAQRLDKLVDVQAATWIDRELVADNPEPLRDAGFGREARDRSEEHTSEIQSLMSS